MGRDAAHDAAGVPRDAGRAVLQDGAHIWDGDIDGWPAAGALVDGDCKEDGFEGGWGVDWEICDVEIMHNDWL